MFIETLTKKTFPILATLIFASLTTTTLSHAVTIKNLDEIQRALNTQSWTALPLKKRVKIAILDKGFYGYEYELGKSLPKDTKYFKGPVETPEDLKVEHGLAMAQIVTALMKKPDLYLYNAYGYSNLKASIEDLIDQKVDLVLYSEVWEFGGNRNGKGFINALVTQATEAGITWVNAAGNFEQTSFTSAIETLEDDWIKLPDQNHSLKVICNSKDKCPLRAVLSWNDFKDDPEQGTDKDLDFALTDDFLNILETSALKQTSDPKETRPGYSSYPRETIVKELEPGTYFLRIKNRSDNFDEADELFIAISGEGLTVPSHTPGQSLLNPADHPEVMTVGALDSERSSYNRDLNKPNLLTLSTVKTPDGEFRGSSNSAAFVAGALGLVKSRVPQKDFAEILETSQLPGWSDNHRGISVYWLGFSAPMGRCFRTYQAADLPQHLVDIVNLGGVLVETTMGYRLMTPFDPIWVATNLNRYQPNDMILATTEGFRLAPRNAPYTPAGWVEVFQTPQELALCNPPRSPGNIFRLRAFSQSN
jgi:hypothetical protein